MDHRKNLTADLADRADSTYINLTSPTFTAVALSRLAIDIGSGLTMNHLPHPCFICVHRWPKIEPRMEHGSWESLTVDSADWADANFISI